MTTYLITRGGKPADDYPPIITDSLEQAWLDFSAMTCTGINDLKAQGYDVVLYAAVEGGE